MKNSHELAKKLATIAFDTVNANMIEPFVGSFLTTKDRMVRDGYIDRIAERLHAALGEEAAE